MIYPYNKDIQEELDSLCKITTSDFSGLAWIDQHDNRIRWLYVSGNSNERFKRLALKPGYGLSGLVLKLGRPVIIDTRILNSERIRMQHDYSIMMVEELHAAIAVPLVVYKETRGVLLIGNRSERYYEENDLQLLSNLIERFEQLLQ